jgi:hypothetical protein
MLLWEVVLVGAVIMLGTLFGLIALIFGGVYYFDPEARGASRDEPIEVASLTSPSDEH